MAQDDHDQRQGRADRRSANYNAISLNARSAGMSSPAGFETMRNGTGFKMSSSAYFHRTNTCAPCNAPCESFVASLR